MKTPTPHEGKAGVPEARQHHTTELFSGVLRVFVAEFRAAAPWVAMGFALGAIIEAAAVAWRALS